MDTANHTSTASSDSKPAGSSPQRAHWVWFIAIVLLGFWAFHLAAPWMEMAMFPRFISRMGVSALFLLLFLAWWLSNKQVHRRDRWLAVALLVVGTIAAQFLADPTVGAFGAFLTFFPYVVTTWALWYFVTRNASPVVQRVGIYLATILIFGCAFLVRWDGLDGAQRTQLSWRWSPTPEQLFLEGHDRQADRKSEEGEIQLADWTLQPGDWPEFRGPNRDAKVTGVSVEPFSASPPQRLWRQRVGPAWSSMILVDGHLVTQEQRGDSEAVVCYEANTGKENWTALSPGRFEEPLSGTGPRATPTFHNGRIYALGAKGTLTCVAASTGIPLWSKDIPAEAKADIPQWGSSVTPLVVDGTVIVFAGGTAGKSILAYNAETGETLWSAAGGTFSHSSPQVFSIQGERQILIFDSEGLTAFSPKGTKLWQRPKTSSVETPMLQPHLLNDREFLIQSDPGIALFDVKANDGNWTVGERWSSTKLKPGFNDFLVDGDYIYGLDDGILCCLDLKDGQRVWKKGRFGHGQMLHLVDQKALLILSEKGEVALVAASPKGYEELGRFQAIEGKCWNHPVLAHGHLYVRNGEEMACYKLHTKPQAGTDTASTTTERR